MGGPGTPQARPRGCQGWWEAKVDSAGPGTDYFLSLDGGPLRPDPRSAYQPDGIDGVSRVVVHSAFEWSDSAWGGTYLPAAIIYELHIGTFTPEGTFEAAIDRLEHLVDLGVTCVELMPVAEFSGDRGWGYDGVDLYAPHHAYGGPDGLKRLVDACHGHGLGVVMDVVYNHLGPAGNYLGEFGPYFTSGHTTNWGDAVNFDGPGSYEVREFVIDNALMWLRDYHCDGLRLDAVHAIKDDSALTILEQLARRVDRLAAHLGRPLFLIAESDRNDPAYVRSPQAGGYGLDSAWADEFHHALHAVLTGDTSGYYSDFGSLDLVARAARQAWVYAGDYSPHRQRIHGRPPHGLDGSRFVVFLQNHDQVGNRATGDRITRQISVGRAKVGAALVLLSPFVPMLFMGEEWAASTPFQYFTDHRDRDLAAAVSGGRRQEFSSFGWAPDEVPDPQAPATFVRSKLDWDERATAPHAEMLAWYLDLVRLRRAAPSLGDGDRAHVRTRHDGGAGWLVVERMPFLIAVNLGDGDRLVPVPVGGRLVLSSEEGVEIGGPGDGPGDAGAGASEAAGADRTDFPDRRAPAHVRLPADSVAVIEYPSFGEDPPAHA